MQYSKCSIKYFSNCQTQGKKNSIWEILQLVVYICHLFDIIFLLFQNLVLLLDIQTSSRKSLRNNENDFVYCTLLPPCFKINKCLHQYYLGRQLLRPHKHLKQKSSKLFKCLVKSIPEQNFKKRKY